MKIVKNVESLRYINNSTNFDGFSQHHGTDTTRVGVVAKAGIV